MKKETYAVVTGASSGIGYQYARVLAGYGYKIILVSNEEDAVSDKAGRIKADFGTEAVPLCMDLGRQDAAKELYCLCRERGYEVEFLVNNAGVYHDRDFLDDTEEFNGLILNLHVFTPAMLEYHFAKDMVAKGRGYIINMSSVTSGFGIQRMAAYSSTKGFLQLFSRSTHVELHGKGVNVTCVRPGAVATALYNLRPPALRAGLALGYIITPEKLASKAVKAAFKGRAQITPGLYTKLLQCLVGLIPTRVLRLIRRWNIF